MIQKIRVMTANYKNIRLSQADAKRVRGFFADLDNEDSNLHNHKKDGEQIYRYPQVQYKILREHPVIVAIEDGIRSIHPHLMEQKQLKIGNDVYTDMALDIKLSEFPIGDSKCVREYSFLTPWIALNQENFKRYVHAGEEERRDILNNILVGNLLSMCKGNGVTIENKLQAAHQLRVVPVFYKGKKMEGFTGTFRINCCIPDLFGIGKGTARGFGTVKSIRKMED